MVGKSRIKTFVVILAVCFLLLSSSSRVEAQSKNFYFPNVRIEVNIGRDGSFTVDEYRTYDFQGSFSWALLTINLHVIRNGYSYTLSIEDFKILDESGRPLRMETSRRRGVFEAKWYYAASNEQRTFHFHYRLRGGIISYPEVSELYWPIIGSGWDKPTKSATVVVHLPEFVSRQEDILVYGHGPLSGMVEIVDRKTTRFTASNIRAGQFMEIRMVWPAGLVSGVSSNRHTRESIMQEEARFVQETIEEARRAQEEAAQRQKRQSRLLYFWLAWLIAAPLIWLPFYVRSWKKVGKDYRFDDIPEYSRELPSDLSPALVEVLLREGRDITPRSFTATLFDLARRGYIELDDKLIEKRRLFGTKQVYETTVILKKEFMDDSKLHSFEHALLHHLFVTVGEQYPKKGAQIKLEELEDYLQKKAKEFQKWYRGWMKSVRRESKKLEFIEPASSKMRTIFLAATMPLAFFTGNIVLLLLSSILIPKIKRRGRHWARENELWRALDRFLDDFARFKDLPPEAYKLWEHYLVFGILFGNAKKIIKKLPIILKDERAVAPVWYYGFNRASFIRTGRIESMINSIESMSTSIVQASTSAAHYSSGGGGGFSGGGGGGGGAGSGGTAG
ncbi:MAG: DUF2207 domain-containing protein [Candidatus Aminicenantes bacterium]|nr:MAG: DUF2207 domain-containing protein [Candidatus Aminicenantes bacterium]